MKVGAINEMTQAYREYSPVDNRELERNIEKIGTPQVPEIKEPVKPEQDDKTKPEINDGRETIGISKDGDVAKASRTGLENVSEGIVIKKSPESAQKTELPDSEKAQLQDSRVSDDQKKVTEEKNTGNVEKPDALIGYSKSELERLYLQGDISSNQLNKELERREEIRGEKKDAAQDVREDEKVERKTNEEIAVAAETNRETGVKAATEQQAEVTGADKAAGEKQVQEVQENRQEEKTKESTEKVSETAADTRKQIITEELADDKRFTEEMTVLAGAERNDELVSEALDTAVENDRLKLMEQVLNVDPAMASNV